jgi:CARDB protein
MKRRRQACHGGHLTKETPVKNLLTVLSLAAALFSVAAAVTPAHAGGKHVGMDGKRATTVSLPEADLTAEMWVTSGPWGSRPYTITCVVKNQGQRHSGACKTRIVIRNVPDTYGFGTHVIVTDYNIPSIPAGGEYRFGYQVYWIHNETWSSYADIDNTVPEENEKNNSSYQWQP